MSALMRIKKWLSSQLNKKEHPRGCSFLFNYHLFSFQRLASFVHSHFFGSFYIIRKHNRKMLFFSQLYYFFDSSGISRLTAIFITSNCWYYLAYAHYNTERRIYELSGTV